MLFRNMKANTPSPPPKKAKITKKTASKSGMGMHVG